MKQTRYLATGLLAGALALATVTSATAEPAKERTGKAVRIKGNARYSKDGGKTWQPLKVETEVGAGTIVNTAKDSFVDFVMGDPNAVAPKPAAPGSLADYQPVAQRDVVRVLDDTYISIDKLTATATGADTVTDTQVDLKNGKVFFTVKKMSAASRFEIKIPNGVAGIRGTVGLCGSEGILAILAGSGVLAYSKADGSLVTQVVPGGYIFDARSNELTRMAKIMEGNISRMSQECFFPGPPPSRPPHPIPHYSPYKPKPGHGGNNQGGGGGNQND